MRALRISAYDTLGYLATGYALLFLLDWALGHCVFGCRIMLNSDPSLGGSVFVGVLSYVTGHLLGHASQYLIEELIVKRWYAPRDLDLFSDDPRLNWSKIVYLSTETRRRIRKRMGEEKIRETGSDLFYRFDIIVKRNEIVADRLNAFLVLYGFCRNMALALFVSSAAFLVRDVLEMWETGAQPGIHWFSWPVCLVSGYCMYHRYIKFYGTYTSTVFRNFAEGDKPQESK